MCRLLLMTIAILLILFGISGLWMMPKLVQQKIEQRLQLKIGTKTFDRFTKVPIPLTVKFYLFNVTNSERVLAGLERPQFEEVGPFMYKQWRRREIIDFEDYNRRLRYKEFKTYYPMFTQDVDNNSNNNNNTTRLDSDNGGAADNSDLHNTTTAQTADHQQEHPFMLDPRKANVTIINLPLLSVLTKLAQLEDGSLKKNIAAKVASRLIIDGRDKILITKPANELLFDGYKVDFMESARDLVSGTLGFNFESPLPKNKFGFFYMKNNTWSRRNDGELTVFTGRNDSMNNFMLVDNWNDQRQLNVWPKNTPAGNRCNAIRGTDGSQFHPGANKHQLLEIFTPLVCTTIRVKYQEDVQVRDIPLLRFAPLPSMFGAPRKSIQNACYCTIQQGAAGKSENQSVQSQRINDSRCYLDGLLDLSLCQRGAPVAASSPHFYNGDPMLVMAAGLRPQKARHETYLDIEPMTGAVMRAASRAQLNAYVEQAALDVVDSSIIGNMTHMVAPLLWFEEAAEIDEKSSNEFKGQLLNIVQKARRTFIIAIVAGMLIALIVGAQFCYITCYKLDHGAANAKETKSSRAGSYRKRQFESNLRGARRSNFYGKTKPALARKDVELDDDEAAALPASLAAASIVLGAAIAGPSSAPNRRKRDISSRLTGAGGSRGSSMKLVANEWDVGEATTTASSSGRSSHQGCNETQVAGETSGFLAGSGGRDGDETLNHELDDDDQ